MPIYEYTCKDCDADFEKLVFSGDTEGITCPECQSPRVVKQMSAASVTGGSSCASNGPKPFS